MKSFIYFLKFALLVVTFSACAQQVDKNADSLKIAALEEPQTPLLTQVKANNYSPKNLKILIDKSAYTLQVYHKDSLLITYPCVFGFDPVSDKMQEGDGATPEGEFGIRSMYPHKSWS